jgi:predicted DNA-binding transcriptional regulator AlpA
MTEPTNFIAEALAAIMRPIVQAAVRDALTTHRVEDRLLETEEAAKVLAVSPDWLYRHAKNSRLPVSSDLRCCASHQKTSISTSLRER